MSNRLTLVTALLVGLALIPTLRHSYFEVTADDGFTSAAIDPQLAGMYSRPTERTAGWVKKTFDTDDWVERRYKKPEGGEITLFVTRSYDLKRLYHHPELAIVYGTDLREGGVQPLAGMTNVPLHVLRGEADRGVGLAAYALAYNGQFVEDPYWFQLRVAGELVFTARRPMTLFFAFDDSAPANAPVADHALTKVLGAAIQSFASQTPFARTVHPDAATASRLAP